jgi:hypothetical protein
MKKFIISCLTVLCFLSIGKAQDYNTGIGIRGGFESGLTVKYFTAEKTAFEFLIASRWKGFEATGLYEIHNRAFDTDRLKWYFGLGGHLGIWNGDNTYKEWGTQGKSYTVIGVDGILGMEYSFTELPINISIDWKPSANLIGYQGFWADGGAISVRYIF